MHLDGEAFAQAHQLNHVAVGEVDAFSVELVVRDLQSFHCFLHYVLVHDVGCDLIDDLAIFFLYGRQLNNGELVHGVGGLVPVTAVAARRQLL